MNKSVATVLTQERAMSDLPSCSKCEEELTPDNTSDSSMKYGLCLSCLTTVLGEEISDSIALLLAKAVIMVCHYRQDDAFKLRCELRSSSRFDLQKTAKDLGAGRVYNHSTGIYRWSCASMKDLDRIGKILMPFQPILGILLQRYVVQPNKQAKSAFAEACAQKLGARTIRIIEHI